MKRFLAGFVAALIVASVAIGGFLSLGFVSFAADEPHSRFLTSLISMLRERSIARAAADIVVPPDLDSPARALRGAGNYDAMCAGCHLKPGNDDTEIRRGLYPKPPALTVPAAENENRDARRFWIVKHGIKGSGMSAWAKGGIEDESIWDLVAFMRQLPQLSNADYLARVQASGGHAHAGLNNAMATAGEQHPGANTPAHSHTNHKHPPH